MLSGLYQAPACAARTAQAGRRVRQDFATEKASMPPLPAVGSVQCLAARCRLVLDDATLATDCRFKQSRSGRLGLRRLVDLRDDRLGLLVAFPCLLSAFDLLGLYRALGSIP